MAIHIKASTEVSAAEVEALELRMRQFYEDTPPEYYATADQGAENYQADTSPFHCHLLSTITAGEEVCEVGCGTAHFCPQVEHQGGQYTGYDWSDDLLALNRKRFPAAHFASTLSDEAKTFDLVVSLYTIEHVPNPRAYLKRLWNLCKAGGRVAIICPDFVNGPGLPSSVFFGQRPLRLREKVSKGLLVDALEHLWEVEVGTRLWKFRARKSAPEQFFINLMPRILEGADYTIDSDAVHLPRYEDLRHWFEVAGGILECCSRSLQRSSPAAEHSLYLLVRKPV